MTTRCITGLQSDEIKWHWGKGGDFRTGDQTPAHWDGI